MDRQHPVPLWVGDVLSIAPGHSVDYLTREVAAGRENYYTGAVSEGEPPGRWYGAGATSLGLTGLVNHQDMTAVYEHFVDPRDPNFRDPDRWDDAAKLGHGGRSYPSADDVLARLLDGEPNADPERIEQLRLDASKRARRNIAFMDITYSVQKSVTVLHAAFEAQEVNARRAGDQAAAMAWATHKEAVEDAIWAGNNAALDYLAEQAGYSRVGHHGGSAGRFIDAHDWTVASFFQHTSRTNDPQLHIHNAALWRVQGSDGVWRTPDSRSLYLHRPAAAAIGERTTTEHLARSLGVRVAMRPDGRAREILGIPTAVTDLFSTRRRAITPRTAELVAAHEHRFGRAPNALQLNRLQRQATMATRPRKSHDGETLEQRLDRWERHLRAEISLGLDQVAADVLALAGARPQPEPFDAGAVMQTAIADVQTTKASWTEADLARAINDALPDYLGGLSSEDAQALVQGLARAAIDRHCVTLTADGPGNATLPDELRLIDGRPAYERPGGHLYASADHIRSERVLRAGAFERTAAIAPPDVVTAFLEGLAESGIELGADQANAVRGVLTSGATLESLVGPAGTGKSFVVGAIAHAWQHPATWAGQRRAVVGLATSQIATDVLTSEGLTARNIRRWLQTQKRVVEGRPLGDDLDWRLGRGDLVVIDESAMVDLSDLAAVHRIVESADAKLLLTGDHRQLAAVGAAGGMEMIARVSPAYELTEARRFVHEWERSASLRLREGDQTSLTDYRKHGRIIDGGTIEHTEQAAVRAWLADTLNGHRSLLIVDSNEQVDRLCAQLRADLVRLGRVEENGVSLGLQGTIAGVGDLVQARRNGWALTGLEGNRRGPINRELYRVLATRDDAGLIVAPVVGRTGDGDQLGDPIMLPGDYVAEHVALGYAATVHSAQGLTVDTSHTVATNRTGPAAFYVGMSRGRETNTAYICTRAVPDDLPPGTVHHVTHIDPLAVLASSAERAELELAAIVEAERSADEAGSFRAAAERFIDAADLATAGRTAAMLDDLVDEGALTPTQRIALATDEGTSSLARILRQAEIAGHDPRQILTDAVASRDLSNARSLASVLHHRISDSHDLRPAGNCYADWTPAVDDPTWQRHLDYLAEVADDRRTRLGHELTANPPRWAIESFGSVPDGLVERAAWTARAATVAAHRELTGHTDLEVALPASPKPGQVETYASWRAACRAMGDEEVARAEAEMSDGQLRVRVRAYERELVWQPDYVAPDLSGTMQAAERHRASAVLLAAEALATVDDERRRELAKKATDAETFSDVLRDRAVQLERADQARSLWYAHTANTRLAAQRAEAELGARGVPADHSDAVTAEEWLDSHRADQAAEDPHRSVFDPSELTDIAGQRDRDLEQLASWPARESTEIDVRDIREQSEGTHRRPITHDVDWGHVPTADQSADSIARAQRALVELSQRAESERRREEDESRSRDLHRWQHDDQVAQRQGDEAVARAMS